ncbi:MAG: hypothetical protein QMB81_04935 [Pontimonas sp.]
MDVTLATWGVVLGVIIALLVLDLLTFSRNPREIGTKESSEF